MRIFIFILSKSKWFHKINIKFRFDFFVTKYDKWAYFYQTWHSFDCSEDNCFNNCSTSSIEWNLSEKLFLQIESKVCEYVHIFFRYVIIMFAISAHLLVSMHLRSKSNRLRKCMSHVLTCSYIINVYIFFFTWQNSSAKCSISSICYNIYFLLLWQMFIELHFYWL